MHPKLRTTRSAALATVLVLLLAAPAAAVDWSVFAETKTIRIVTQDEDVRETKVWIVVVDGAGHVRTNDSRWLANIRRGSSIEIRAGDTALRVTASEVDDEAVRERVEEAFKEKYGFTQKVMSFFRIKEPTVLRLEPAS